MAYVFVSSFKNGIDARRTKVNAQQGSFFTASNVHINRGGEIEKRKAFVPKYTLPAGLTKGLYANNAGVYVFGTSSISGQLFPRGIEYYQLSGFTTGYELNEVMSVDSYDNNPYVSAKLTQSSNGNSYFGHFYSNGAGLNTQVHDWQTIENASSFATTREAVKELSELMDIDPNATVEFVTGSVTTVTAPSILITANTANTGLTITALPVGTSPNLRSLVSVIIPASAGVKGVWEVSFLGDIVLATANTVFKISINGNSYQTSSRETYGTHFVKTFKTKMYASSGSLMQFSHVNDPRSWGATSANKFSGYENLAAQTGSYTKTIGAANYQNYMAIFARRNTQIWQMVPGNPVDNQVAQLMDGIGSVATGSITSFGELDVFFLSDTGIRSLRARDSSNAAVVFDIGTSIDPIVQDAMKTYGYQKTKRAKGIIEPTDGRYLLAIGSKVFVYSFFPASQISAWTTYDLGFEVEAWAVQDNRLYCRSGDTIYLYGGLDNNTYDSSLASVELSWLSADKPAHRKRFYGLDVSCDGTWKAEISTDPVTNQFVTTGYVIDQNFSLPSFRMSAIGTHIGLKFSTTDASFSRLSSACVHFDFTDPAR
jgi:hypothetical protein